MKGGGFGGERSREAEKGGREKERRNLVVRLGMLTAKWAFIEALPIQVRLYISNSISLSARLQRWSQCGASASSIIR